MGIDHFHCFLSYYNNNKPILSHCCSVSFAVVIVTAVFIPITQGAASSFCLFDHGNSNNNKHWLINDDNDDVLAAAAISDSTRATSTVLLRSGGLAYPRCSSESHAGTGVSTASSSSAVAATLAPAFDLQALLCFELGDWCILCWCV
eukprot:jgi/Psemu1/70531/estExt_Genemark1.C_24670002